MRSASAVLLVLVVLAAACSGKSNDRHPGTTSTSPSAGVLLDHSPAMRPIHFGPRLWSGTDGGPFPVVTSGIVHGNSIVLLGGDDANWEDRLAVVDAATGRLNWQVRNLDKLPNGAGAELWVPIAPQWPFVAGSGADWTLLVEYIRDNCEHPSGFCQNSPTQLTEEFGVAALSGRDGSVRWSTPLVAAVPSESPAADRDPTSTLVAASDTTAIVSVYDRPRYSTDPASPPTTVALDVTTGKQVWKRSGVTPQLLAGDTVLAWLASTPPNTGRRQAQTLVVLDSTTGKLRWRWPERLLPGGPIVAAGNTAVIPTIAAGRISTLVIDLEKGREVATDLDDNEGSCAADDTSGGQPFVACAVGDFPDYHLATFRGSDRHEGISKAEIPSGRVEMAWQGYVFVASNSDRPDVAIDDAGNVLSADVPGEVVDINNEYAIFAFREGSNGRNRYAVRRVGR